MLTIKRTVLAGALLAGLSLGTIGCTDTNDAGKLPPASDGGSDTKADGTTATGGSGGASTDGGGTGGAGGAASDGGGTGGAAADASAG